MEVGNADSKTLSGFLIKDSEELREHVVKMGTCNVAVS